MKQFGDILHIDQGEMYVLCTCIAGKHSYTAPEELYKEREGDSGLNDRTTRKMLS